MDFSNHYFYKSRKVQVVFPKFPTTISNRTLRLRLLRKKLRKPSKITRVPIISKNWAFLENTKPFCSKTIICIHIYNFLAILWQFFQIILIFKGITHVKVEWKKLSKIHLWLKSVIGGLLGLKNKKMEPRKIQILLVC